MTNRVQGGDDGGKSQEGALNRGVMAGAQATAREAPHGGFDEGRMESKARNTLHFFQLSQTKDWHREAIAAILIGHDCFTMPIFHLGQPIIVQCV